MAVDTWWFLRCMTKSISPWRSVTHEFFEPHGNTIRQRWMPVNAYHHYLPSTNIMYRADVRLDQNICCRCVSSFLWHWKNCTQTEALVHFPCIIRTNQHVGKTWFTTIVEVCPEYMYVRIVFIYLWVRPFFRLSHFFGFCAFPRKPLRDGPQTWLMRPLWLDYVFGHTPLNFLPFMAVDGLSIFHTFTNKPLIGVTSNLEGQLGPLICWRIFGYAPPNSCFFLTSDWSSSFCAFTDKQLIGLRSYFGGPDYLLVMLRQCARFVLENPSLL